MPFFEGGKFESNQMIQCTAIHLVGGYEHEHIASIKYSGEGGGEKSRAQMVKYVEDGGTAYCIDAAGDRANLQVRISSAGTKYVQTKADGIWKNNLLALPRY